jgi:hypothetical protein
LPKESAKFWKDFRNRQDEFFQIRKANLRHGRSFVPVSTIANQFYCEYKVEDEFLQGPIQTKTKQEGTAFHDELIPTVKVTERQFIDAVSKKTPSLGVLRLWGTLADIPVIGDPDGIIWSQGRPLWLLELKTTKGDPMQVWDSELYQILIYGALLEKMDFDCSSLRLALVRMKARELSDEEKEAWLNRVSKHLMQNRIDEFEASHHGTVRVHILNQDLHAAELGVLRMKGYWLGEREPTSSSSIGKCRACERTSICPKTLYGRP